MTRLLKRRECMLWVQSWVQVNLFISLSLSCSLVWSLSLMFKSITIDISLLLELFYNICLESDTHGQKSQCSLSLSPPLRFETTQSPLVSVCLSLSRSFELSLSACLSLARLKAIFLVYHCFWNITCLKSDTHTHTPTGTTLTPEQVVRADAAYTHTHTHTHAQHTHTHTHTHTQARQIHADSMICCWHTVRATRLLHVRVSASLGWRLGLLCHWLDLCVIAYPALMRKSGAKTGG